MVCNISSINHHQIASHIAHLGEKEDRVVMQQAAGGIDRMERSWSPTHIRARHAGSNTLTGNQLRQDLRRWLSPSDPSTNHNIACNAHHDGTANWFFNGSFYKEWRSTGSSSLIWIHGKRVLLSHSLPNTA